jgi:zinc carboxypeptidase
MIPALTALATLSVPAHAPAVAPPALTSAVSQDTRIEVLEDRSLRLALRRLEGDHTGRAHLMSIGNSRGGRSIDVLRIAEGELRPGRPALLLVAGMEGTQAWTSGLALDHARSLLEGYGEDDAITALIDTTTIYVLARANPDGCERRFESPHAERLASGRGVDDDRDGREAEDPIDDLDGDDAVLWMRVPDPEGEWIVDPAEPRVLKRANREQGERGVYALHREGRDADGDDRVAEDGERNTEWHRNFPALWEEHQARAGRFPGEEPGVKAVMDFVLTHPELSMVIAYGELDDLNQAPPTMSDGARGTESPGRPADDVALLKEFGRRYAKAVESPRPGAQDEEGRLQTWLVQHRGMQCISVHPWSAPAELPEADEAADEAAAPAEDDADSTDQAPAESAPEPSDDAKTLAWLESHEVDAYRDWTAFEHPDLGPVEIGGWMPHARIEPPAALHDTLADEHFAFFLELAGELPRIEIAECSARALGEGVHEITVVIENAKLLPFTTAAGEQTRTLRPIRVQLVFAEGGELLAGPRRVTIDELAGTGGRHTMTWLVRASDPTSVAARVVTDHAGIVTRNAEVSR